LKPNIKNLGHIRRNHPPSAHTATIRLVAAKNILIPLHSSLSACHRLVLLIPSGSPEREFEREWSVRARPSRLHPSSPFQQPLPNLPDPPLLTPVPPPSPKHPPNLHPFSDKIVPLGLFHLRPLPRSSQYRVFVSHLQVQNMTILDPLQLPITLTECKKKLNEILNLDLLEIIPIDMLVDIQKE
jgi:hypothetical protein